LLDGCYYSMRIPDYGKGDWNIKIEKNRELPYIKDIGCNGGKISITLSQAADSIKVFGKDHATLEMTTGCDRASYTMRDDDPFARFTVYFPGGEVIYSNPFARYDADCADTPFREPRHNVNMPLTILFNAALLAMLAALIFLFYKKVIRQ
jgi:hypothetical protein